MRKAFVKKSLGTRIGKGFSLSELKQANMSIHDAKVLKITFDKRRKSFYKKNIEALLEEKQRLK